MARTLATGKLNAHVAQLLALPKGPHALLRAPSSVPLPGQHSGLSQDEMLVPLIGTRVEALTH